MLLRIPPNNIRYYGRKAVGLHPIMKPTSALVITMSVDRSGTIRTGAGRAVARRLSALTRKGIEVLTEAVKDFLK